MIKELTTLIFGGIGMKKIFGFVIMAVILMLVTAGCLFQEETLTIDEEYTLESATEARPIVKKIQLRGLGHVGNSYIWDDGVNLYIKIVSLMPEWKIDKAAIYFTTPDNMFALPRDPKNNKRLSLYAGPYAQYPPAGTLEVMWSIPLSEFDTDYIIWWSSVDFINRDIRKRATFGPCGNRYYF